MSLGALSRLYVNQFLGFHSILFMHCNVEKQHGKHIIPKIGEIKFFRKRSFFAVCSTDQFSHMSRFTRIYNTSKYTSEFTIHFQNGQNGIGCNVSLSGIHYSVRLQLISLRLTNLSSLNNNYASPTYIYIFGVYLLSGQNGRSKEKNHRFRHIS